MSKRLSTTTGGLFVIAAVLVGLAPSATAVVTSTVVGGVLTVTGDADPDLIDVECRSAGVSVNGLDPETGLAPCGSITSMVVNGNGADDWLDLSRVRAEDFPSLTSVTMDGDDGEDRLQGSGLADSLIGGPGDDFILANLAEGDVPDGGKGFDELLTFVATDATILDGALVLPDGPRPFQGLERLWVDGGPAAQSLDARNYSSALRLSGGAGDDRLWAGSLGSSLSGDAGDDVLVGGAGNDFLFGGRGDDVTRGEGGRDSLEDSPGRDRLIGGEGRDYFQGPIGDRNFFDGGLETDTFGLFSWGRILITDSRVRMGRGGSEGRFRSIEVAEVRIGDSPLHHRVDARRYSGDALMRGSPGPDVLLGGSGDDELIGLGGDDVLEAGLGRDELDGGGGTDVCHGGPGPDHIVDCE